MRDEKDFSWVDDVSSRVDDTTELLSENIDEEKGEIEKVHYGPENVFEDSETYREAEGLLTDAESSEEICQFISEVNLGRIEISGPSQFPSTTYHLDYTATQEGKVWEFKSVDADRELEAQNNYVRKLEDTIENELQEDEYINRVTESYQSDSEFMETLANTV